MTNIWDQAGMDRYTFVHLPGKEKAKLLRRHRGIRIFTCCELKTLKHAFANPVKTLFKAWCADNAEKYTIKQKYPHAQF